MSFSTFIFSSGIKLFIRHPVVLFGILILSEQCDGFVQLSPWCIFKGIVKGASHVNVIFVSFQRYFDKRMEIFIFDTHRQISVITSVRHDFSEGRFFSSEKTCDVEI